MWFLGLTKRAATFVVVISFPLISLCAQNAPKTEDESFDVEPPLLVKPWEQQGASDASVEDAPETELDAGKISKRLEAAKKEAAAATRLVKIGILSKTEAEQRALRVVRLESELAKAQMLAAAQEVTAQKSCLALREATQAEVEVATATFAQAQAAAQSAEENYRKAQLENAALNLSRQRKLFSLGSALKSDVARAEERLAKLQQDEQGPR
jgi:hypothetical protein